MLLQSEVLGACWLECEHKVMIAEGLEETCCVCFSAPAPPGAPAPGCHLLLLQLHRSPLLEKHSKGLQLSTWPICWLPSSEVGLLPSLQLHHIGHAGRRCTMHGIKAELRR